MVKMLGSVSIFLKEKQGSSIRAAGIPVNQGCEAEKYFVLQIRAAAFTAGGITALGFGVSFTVSGKR